MKLWVRYGRSKGARWAGGGLCCFAAIQSGVMELWLGHQPRSVSGSWSSWFFWDPLVFLFCASVVCLAAGLSTIPVSAKWSLMLAVAAPLSVCIVLREWTVLSLGLVLVVLLLSQMFLVARRMWPLAQGANLALVIWWLVVSVQTSRDFLRPRGTDTGGLYVALVFAFVALLLCISLLIVIRGSPSESRAIPASLK